MEFNIGGVRCRNNLSLAPMAGISDAALRVLCLRGGAGLVCAEMVSAVAASFNSKRTIRMLTVGANEHPCSMQIFGADSDAVRRTVIRAISFGADIIDINAGCPVPKIVKSGAGIALMRNETAFASIIAAAVSAAGKTPVTVKTRVGLKKGAPQAAQLARIAQNEGASAMFLHGRYAHDVHSGPVDLDEIASACAAVKIPVIGNGGACDEQSVNQFLSAGCKGVMIGRAAIGDPFIFSRITGQECVPPLTQNQRLELFLEYLEMSARSCGEKDAVVRSRKVAGYWIHGFADCSQLRAQFMKLENMEQARALLRSSDGI